jgi:hypothetical protein
MIATSCSAGGLSNNSELADPLDPQGTEWAEFQTTGTAQPVLGGLGSGNTDT